MRCLFYRKRELELLFECSLCVILKTESIDQNERTVKSYLLR